MTDQPTTAEIVKPDDPQPNTRPAEAAQASSGPPMTLFGTTNPAEVIEAATEAATALTKILEEQHLYKAIGQRKHVLIEGWTLLGSMLGVFGTTVWTRELTDANGKLIGWEARSEARTLDGRLVGAAEGECRFAESKWADRDSYALRSMAQTRAQSKALASPLRFVVELAGFAGTPAEEMTGDEYTNGGAPAYEHKPGHPVYDNRGDERSTPKSEGGQGWPVFKCKVKACTDSKDGRPWVTWDPHYFDDPTVKAKKQLLSYVEGHKGEWGAYYPSEDPSYDQRQAEIVAGAHADDDATQMAGYLWSQLTQVAAGGLIWPADDDDRPNARDLDVVVRAAKIALSRAGEDAGDIISEVQALELALMEVEEVEHEQAAAFSDYG